MADRQYWLDLFTGKTWTEFLEAGATVTGFRESRWKTVQRIKTGDYLLCYLTGVSRWIGVLEAASKPYWDETPIWHDEVFPCRIGVQVVTALDADTAVPIQDLSAELSIFQNAANSVSWTGHLRGSPTLWKSSDGAVVVRAIEAAKQNPVSRPVDLRKFSRRPRSLTTKIGQVVVPSSTDEDEGRVEAPKESSSHIEIQWLLLKLGNDLGLDVWVARNDRGRSFNDNSFAKLPRLRSSLPHQFDDATNRTIELIDVLWLSGNAIVAAFEIESTTSIYSGLLRMSDLIAMQPNLNIPLYLVAPDERRDKVISEVNRPTFARLIPPMRDMCRYISFSALRERIADITPYLRYMKPDIVNELSESCEPDYA